MALSYMLSAYLQSLFLAPRLVLIPFESQQEGTSADHIYGTGWTMHWIFSTVAILCTNIFLRDRLPAFIAAQFCMGGPLWVRRSPHSTCVDCVYSCFYYVCCMGWISFQVRKKESTYVFNGGRTPAQAFSTFCSSTQSTDGWSDTRAFILT